MQSPRSKMADQLQRSGDVIATALTIMSVGTADNPRAVRRIDLAVLRAEERMGGQLPSNELRGGSSSPGTRDEDQERRRVIRQAGVDASDIPRIAKELDALTLRLERAISRQVEIVDPTNKLGEDAGLPGCRSCARFKFFEGVDERSPGRGLCRWCREFEDAYAQLPPEPALRLRHCESPRAAGLWVARSPELREAAARVERARVLAAVMPSDDDPLPPCGTSYTHLGTPIHCHRAQGHDGDHAGVDESGERVAWPIAVSA